MNLDDISGRLMAGEQILWSGRPQQGLFFTPRDALLIPFSIFWGGFAIFWEYSVLSIGARSSHARPPLFFALWGVPFILIGLFLIFGRFLLDAYLRSRITYALTNRRVLIARAGPFQKFYALNLDRLPGLALSGSGTIIFGGADPFVTRRGFSGWIPSLSPIPQFLAIENAGGVFNQIQQLIQTKA